MKLNTIILSLLIVFSFILTGCEKKEIFGHKTVYGEATINGKHLVQYAKAEESLANQFWYLPLGGNVIAIEDDIFRPQGFVIPVEHCCGFVIH